MAEQNRLAGQRFAMRGPSLADRAVEQMNSATNDRDYITSRGAALANGWRAERTDNNYGQGWKSAPQPSSKFTVNSVVRSPENPAAPAATQESLASLPAPMAPATVQQQASSAPSAPSSPAAPPSAANPTTPATPAATTSQPRMSTQQMTNFYMKRNLPHMTFTLDRSPRMWRERADRMEEYYAQRDMDASNARNQAAQEANRQFRESQQAYATSSFTSPAPSAPNYRRARKRKGLAALRGL